MLLTDLNILRNCNLRPIERLIMPTAAQENETTSRPRINRRVDPLWERVIAGLRSRTVGEGTVINNNLRSLYDALAATAGEARAAKDSATRAKMWDNLFIFAKLHMMMTKVLGQGFFPRGRALKANLEAWRDRLLSDPAKEKEAARSLHDLVEGDEDYQKINALLDSLQWRKNPKSEGARPSIAPLFYFHATATLEPEHRPQPEVRYVQSRTSPAELARKYPWMYKDL